MLNIIQGDTDLEIQSFKLLLICFIYALFAAVFLLILKVCLLVLIPTLHDPLDLLVSVLVIVLPSYLPPTFFTPRVFRGEIMSQFVFFA